MRYCHQNFSTLPMTREDQNRLEEASFNVSCFTEKSQPRRDAFKNIIIARRPVLDATAPVGSYRERRPGMIVDDRNCGGIISGAAGTNENHSLLQDCSLVWLHSSQTETHAIGSPEFFNSTNDPGRSEQTRGSLFQCFLLYRKVPASPGRFQKYYHCQAPCS